MSSAETTIVTKPKSPGLPLQLWLRQIGAILRLELKKNFFGKRAVLVYLLALMPIALLTLIAILPPAAREWLDFAQYPSLFAVIYNALILRTVVFFGCAWIFMNLFRGEIVDRSLHYYFLSSVRREVWWLAVRLGISHFGHPLHRGHRRFDAAHVFPALLFRQYALLFEGRV